VVPEIKPRAILLANLFRDQLDRYGELETIVERWAAVTAAFDGSLVLNADDPAIANLGVSKTGEGTVPSPLLGAHAPVFFGVEDDSIALPGLPHATDAKHCRVCGAPYLYETVFLGHLGRYRCPNGDSERPAPQVSAHHVTLAGVRSARFELRTPVGVADVDLPLPGLYNVYNALGAAALALTLGAPLADVVAGLESVSPAFGRAETVRIGGRDLSILLVKNPAGANEVIRTLALEEGEHDLLGVLNDRTADGRDVSWVWDADFELLAPRVRRIVCSGTRAEELAVRFKYAGIATERLEVVPSLDAALDRAVSGGEGPLYAIPTYTAMLELRAQLVERGVATSSWG
jgi:UDP-N-acetylmuramyl tripeptide synthase